jgi:hypothetical protein
MNEIEQEDGCKIAITLPTELPRPSGPRIEKAIEKTRKAIAKARKDRRIIVGFRPKFKK